MPSDVHAEAQALRAGEPLAAYELLETEAARAAQRDPEAAARMLAEAAAAIQHFDDARAHDAARRSLALSERAGRPGELLARLVVASSLIGLGRPAESRRLVEEFLRTADVAAAIRRPRTLQPVILTLFWLEEYPAVHSLLDRVVRSAREHDDEFLPGALDTLAAVDFRIGRWPSAHARSSEALRLARRRGQRAQAASCLTTLARIEAARGEDRRCLERLDEALVLSGGETILVEYALSARGLLELTLGRHDAAAGELERLLDLPGARGLVEPSVALWVPDLVEARARAGDDAAATALLDEFERRAVTTGRVSAVAAAARCRGLLAEPTEADRHFEAALRAHARVTMPFERARTELAYGEQLRRSRRRAAARPLLQTALGAFERLGAMPWAARARRELAATRTAHRSRGGDVAELLTPHELEVAALVARGATNRETAAALFVSPKTIEYHLSSIYRKLGVRSRTELARRLYASGDTG